jgi:myo-inositol-1(or 4)-monophosphatase
MLSKDEKMIITAAKAGGKIVKNYFGKVLAIEEKSAVQDVRTKADIESEAAIISILEKSFPKYNIFSEECGFIDRKSDYTFYVDPLDGTNNFVSGIPNFSVSIALAKNKETLFGVVYLPLIDLAYYASKGGGAFCNNGEITRSSESDLAKSAVGFICDYHCPRPYIAKTTGNLTMFVKRMLWSWSGAADMCILASGKIESLLNKNTELWDFLAGKLIAKEAGCVVTDLKGKPEENDFNREFLASNNLAIHKKVLPLV